MSLSYIYCGSEDKTDWDTMFKECYPFDNIARRHMIQALNELRLRVADPTTMTPHHIIPRCFYEQMNLPVDNTPKNLIYLTQEEHLWIHCCCVSCCNYNIKPKLKHPVIAMLGYWKDAQREGIAKAKAAGKKFGRPSIPCPPEEEWRPVMERLNKNEITVDAAAKLLNLKKTAFYRMLGKYIDHNRNFHAAAISTYFTQKPTKDENV